MDDYELYRVASDNPALTLPAAQRVTLHRSRSQRKKTTSSNGSKSLEEAADVNNLTKYDVCTI